MKIDKVNGSFNTYKLELSFGELAAIANALEASDTPDAISDEVKAGIRWYLDNLPGPGEDRDEFKAKKDAEKQNQMPANDKGELPGGPDELPGGELPKPGSGAKGAEMEPANDEVDKELPAPPAE